MIPNSRFYHSVEKTTWLLATIWINLEEITLSEISLTQKDKYPIIFNFSKAVLIETGSRMVVTSSTGKQEDADCVQRVRNVSKTTRTSSGVSVYSIKATVNNKYLKSTKKVDLIFFNFIDM